MWRKKILNWILLIKMVDLGKMWQLFGEKNG